MDKKFSGKPASSDVVEEIKNRLDIVDTVSEHVLLKKSGRNYWGCCPFHKEKTPSFSVNPEKGIYKCFGCGEGGDAISFLMKINNTSFWETMTALAQKFGLELPQAGVSKESTDLKNRIVEVNEAAVRFYKKQLLENPEAKQARDYLEKRGIGRDVIEEFNLGFAPDSYDALIKHLSAAKNDYELLFKAGLTSEKTGGGYVDRFRNRIMIPIQNDKGDFIAFGARALSDSQQPKYLNSPDTPVFNKSRSLFALYQAKEAIREQDSVILMEGYFDVISAHVHGIKNVVAMLGTALTEQHVKIIARYTDSRKIYLAFDSDEAGIAATNRGAEVIRSAFTGLGEIRNFDESFVDAASKNDRTVCEIRVITTKTGKDPDEFLRTEGAEAYRKLIENAPLLIDYSINRIINENEQEKKNLTPQEKADIISEIIPLLAEIHNSIIRDEYVRHIADRIGINEESLRTEVNKSLRNVTTHQKKKKISLTVANRHQQYVLAQKNLLSLYFIHTEKFPPLCINRYLKGLTFEETNLETIRRVIEDIIEEVTSSDELFQKLMSRLSDNEEAKKVLTDLIYCAEDKKDLNAFAIEQFVKDHINFLKMYELSEAHNKLRNEYYENDKDDESSLLHQQKVRELIRQRQLGNS